MLTLFLVAVGSSYGRKIEIPETDLNLITPERIHFDDFLQSDFESLN
ncbi:MAG: hypothetical protein ACPGJV_01100 [Bacteriovoracaceae bacterium]